MCGFNSDVSWVFLKRARSLIERKKVWAESYHFIGNIENKLGKRRTFG